MGELIAEHLVAFPILACLLACSGFFSGSETSLFALTREQLRGFEKEKTRTGDLILALLKAPKEVLTSLLLGNTVVNILFFAVSFRIAEDAAGKSAVVGGVLGVVSLMLVIVFGEVGPKGLAVAHTEVVARLIARPLTLFHGLVRPVSRFCVGLIGKISGRLGRFFKEDVYINADELKMLVEMAEKQEVLSGDAPTMMQDVVDLGQTRVKQIMTPRVDMSAFPQEGSRAEFLALVKRTHHKKYPLYRQSLDDIGFFVRTRDVLLQPGKTVKDLAVPAAFVPETQTVEALLRQFRDQKTGCMIVVDEYGGTAGMVTVEDVIEEIFGEIEDEYDEPAAEARQVAADAYMLPGNLSLATWRDLFGQDLPELNVDTVGGLVTALLGRMPKVGDSTQYRGLEFTVSAMRGRRVDKVRLRLTAEARGGGEGGKP